MDTKGALFGVVFVCLIMQGIGFVSASSVASYYFDLDLLNNTEISMAESIKSKSALLQITTSESSTCKYSQTSGLSFDVMEGTFEVNFETVHKKTLGDLIDGVYRYYVKCKNGSGNESVQLTVRFNVNVPVSAQIVLVEGTPVSHGTVEIKVVTSKAVSQTPSLSYSFDGISYDPIPLSGSGVNWEGYILVAKNAGDEVGSFKFQGRDLEGVLGSEITSGDLFVVDTTRPETIIDIEAESEENSIRVRWDSDEDNDEYEVYRSRTPGIDSSDYYRTTSGQSFVDTNVDRGETYYYRVAGVDEAGNKGDLSVEVYTTALLQSALVQNTGSTGLETRFIGLVDGVIGEIEDTIEDVDSVRDSLSRGNEKEIYENLKLSRNMESAQKEMQSLIKEVERFKDQNLDEKEVNKKIDTSRLKLETIKKKVPESIIIRNSKKLDGSFDENDLSGIILGLDPGIEEKRARKISDKSFEIKGQGFSVKREGYNLEIVYLDGESERVSLVKEIVNLQGGDNNVSILESIPEEIAKRPSDIEILNTEYEVVKENLIVSFPHSVKEIVYRVEGEVDLSELERVKTLIYYDIPRESSGSGSVITGYFSFVDFSEGDGSYFGVIVGLLIIAGLGGYFVYVRKDSTVSGIIGNMKQGVSKAEDKLARGLVEEAKEIYGLIGHDYKKLKKRHKGMIYGDMVRLHGKIRGKEAGQSG